MVDENSNPYVEPAIFKTYIDIGEINEALTTDERSSNQELRDFEDLDIKQGVYPTIIVTN